MKCVLHYRWKMPNSACVMPVDEGGHLIMVDSAFVPYRLKDETVLAYERFVA